MFIWLHPLYKGSISLIRGTPSTLPNSFFLKAVPVYNQNLTSGYHLYLGEKKIEAKDISFKCIIYLSWLPHEIARFSFLILRLIRGHYW